MKSTKKHTMSETITITIDRHVEPFKNCNAEMGGKLLSIERKIYVEGDLYYSDHITPDMFKFDQSPTAVFYRWLFSQKEPKRGSDVTRYAGNKTGTLRHIRLQLLKFKYKLLYVFR